MTPWQLLRASRANQAALGYRLHHGPGRPLHHSTAVAVTAAAVAPDSSRSFCLSREKDTLQQLNGRLASYLRQVQYLEAANHKLQCQIQRQLDRKCPSELKELSGHLRTVSLLQDQISECLSTQAQVKLQLLNAELDVYDLNVRCENECEHRGVLEVELNNLRLQEQELVHRLPELQSLLSNQTQQLKELQIQHQQDMQGLLAQMSGGISVEMQPTESFDLIQQLDNMRQMSETTIDTNQNERWFNTQVSMLSSPAVTCEPGSEVIQAELGVLRRRAASLEEELTQLQGLRAVLEDTGRVQNKCFVQQLEVLQQREDSLCRDLDSLLQTVAQQNADQQSLLDVKTRLETEIQDYRRLLDGLRSQRSEEAQSKISGYSALMDDKHLDRQEKKDEKETEDTSHVLNSSSAEQNKVILDADAG
ncbi:keratin, type I cytoskeletal 47 kDa-like [Chaetodon trifascialis]|uniref:keratin, type I cytoskeletal 47 kDa-like n=1 Tax=Chaetodon trifascialis TaxID=109706 RepID=UPI00399466FA